MGVMGVIRVIGKMALLGFVWVQVAWSAGSFAPLPLRSLAGKRFSITKPGFLQKSKEAKEQRFFLRTHTLFSSAGKINPIAPMTPIAPITPID
jgi:hypothetical protein